VVEVPPPPKPAGGVTPCCFKHCTSVVRLALDPAVAAAEVEVVPEPLEELLPHAARARLAVTVASTGITRSARRGFLG
jgi:hypothetical protein